MILVFVRMDFPGEIVRLVQDFIADDESWYNAIRLNWKWYTVADRERLHKFRRKYVQ